MQTINEMAPFDYSAASKDDGVPRERREKVDFPGGGFYDGEWNLEG